MPTAAEPRFSPTLTSIMEVFVDDLFHSEVVNQPTRDYEICRKRASFTHTDEDACELILLIDAGDEEARDRLIPELLREGASADLIDLVQQALNAGVTRLLLYV